MKKYPVHRIIFPLQSLQILRSSIDVDGRGDPILETIVTYRNYSCIKSFNKQILTKQVSAMISQNLWSTRSIIVNAQNIWNLIGREEYNIVRITLLVSKLYSWTKNLTKFDSRGGRKPIKTFKLWFSTKINYFLFFN